MKKIITITNAYTWYNKGDAGILLGTINIFKKLYGEKNIEINILSFTPVDDSIRYCKDKVVKNVYSNILNPRPYKHTKIGKLKAIIKLIIKAIYVYIMINLFKKKMTRKNKVIGTLEKSDIIVVCGGGFLGGKKFDSLMHIFQMYIDTKFTAPVYLIGTSIEPMKSKIVKYYTDKVLNKMKHIFAREVITYKYLEKAVDNNKITLIPDLAFMLEDSSKTIDKIKCLKNKTNNIYGITVREWNFPNYNNSKEKMSNYINVIKNVIEKEIENKNSIFVFVPQVIVENGDDRLLAHKIRNLLKEQNRKNFIVINDDLSPVEIKELISNFNFFIGTRMHSNIFATSMNIPTIAIAYEKKTNGIMNTLDLNDYIVEMDSITEEKLEEKIKKQLINKIEIKKSLDKKIDEIRKEIYNKIKSVLMG